MNTETLEATAAEARTASGSGPSRCRRQPPRRAHRPSFRRGGRVHGVRRHRRRARRLSDGAISQATRCPRTKPSATRFAGCSRDCKVLLVEKVGATPQEMLARGGHRGHQPLCGQADCGAALGELFAAKCAPKSDAPIDASGFRLAHAMLRVADLDRSIDFYTRLLGMQVLERRDHKKNQFSQAYLGYGGGSSQMVLELVSNWTREEPYAVGRVVRPHRHSGLGHHRAVRAARGGRYADAASAKHAAARQQHHRLHRGPRRPPHRAGAAAGGPVRLPGFPVATRGDHHVRRIRHRLHHTHARR